MKILSIIGARPQFIKASVVSKAIRTACQEIILHTGQHYDPNLSKIFFDELQIPPPDINLNIGSGTHAEQTGHMMIEIEKVITNEKPDWVLVYGDTNSTIAGSLASVKIHVPVAHVEAGLRSFNRDMPEEINRVVCDHISTVLFCPTTVSVNNLKNEGVINGVYCIGDVMLDAVNYYIDVSEKKSRILSDLNLAKGQYILATIHRPINTDNPDRLRSIFYATSQSELPVIFPIHPRTKKMIYAYQMEMPSNMIPIDPVGYLDMLQLEKNANCILTDSGGIQKEAYWVGVRCLTLRKETEWTETVELGWNRLVDADEREIVIGLNEWYPSSVRQPVYGDGHASDKIMSILSTYFQEKLK